MEGDHTNTDLLEKPAAREKYTMHVYTLTFNLTTSYNILDVL
jgi:hypothetical protein